MEKGPSDEGAGEEPSRPAGAHAAARARGLAAAEACVRSRRLLDVAGQTLLV